MNKITESEWLIMHVLWKNNPLTSNEIVTAIEKSTNWSPKTIKTLIHRLLSKELISFTSKGRVYYYSPTVTREECIQIENKSFLNRVHKGTLKLMFSSFIENEDLSDEEIDELQKLLENKKNL